MKAYMVKRNSDMIEGRGAMVVDKIFTKLENAIKYINQQSGVFGSPNFVSETKSYGSGWSWEEIDVIEGEFDIQEEKRQQALKKLTREEKELLGLI